jgi:hypothetical protein
MVGKAVEPDADRVVAEASSSTNRELPAVGEANVGIDSA